MDRRCKMISVSFIFQTKCQLQVVHFSIRDDAGNSILPPSQVECPSARCHRCCLSFPPHRASAPIARQLPLRSSSPSFSSISTISCTASRTLIFSKSKRRFGVSGGSYGSLTPVKLGIFSSRARR